MLTVSESVAGGGYCKVRNSTSSGVAGRLTPVSCRSRSGPKSSSVFVISLVVSPSSTPNIRFLSVPTKTSSTLSRCARTFALGQWLPLALSPAPHERLLRGYLCSGCQATPFAGPAPQHQLGGSRAQRAMRITRSNEVKSCRISHAI